MDFSIIIPLYNEQSNLEDLLHSLLKINYDASLFEIIMIDNNSTDDTPVIVQRNEQVLLLSEEKKGSYAARNKGVEAARGSYLCFTDGDCLVDENWLLEAKRAIDEQAPDLIAGNIINTEPQKNVYAKYDDLCFLQQERQVKDDSAATANLVAKKEVFAEAGPFNEQMTTGGDFEFVQRAVKQGFKLLYNEKMIVYHKSRTSFAQVRNKLVRFWQNDRRYPGTLSKVLSLGVLPGARTITRAFRKKSITFQEAALLLIVSLALGCSVMLQVIKPKISS